MQKRDKNTSILTFFRGLVEKLCFIEVSVFVIYILLQIAFGICQNKKKIKIGLVAQMTVTPHHHTPAEATT